MAGPRVVILSSHSLYVEGIASRLRQHLDEDAIHTVDARQTAALERVIAARPSVVILDETDPEVARQFSLSTLLNALPMLTIIRLDVQQDQIQVVTSEQRSVEHVSDLIAVITTTGG